MSPHQSGPLAGTVTSFDLRIRSGSPIVHVSESSKLSGGGMSPGLPRGAPLSAHLAIFEISSAVSGRSFLNRWMPRSFSTNHGGITPACGPTLVRIFIAFAHGLTSSYETSDIGATPSGRWH